MAYRKRTTSTKRARKPARRTRKRTTRKRTTKRTSTRRIASVASTKKSNTLASAIMPAVGTDPSTVFFKEFPLDGQVRMFAWTPSFMQGSAAETSSVRHDTSIYMKGVSEKLEFAMNSAYPVLHRRVIIKWNQRWILPVLADGDNPTRIYRRLDYTDPENSLFKGQVGVDWNDQMRAPIDRDKVAVVSDKLYTYNPPNDKGMIRLHKWWIPINKTIKYADKEDGESRNYDSWPADNYDKYYIIDFVRSHGDSRGDPLGEQYGSFGSNVTIYWHEK